MLTTSGTYSWSFVKQIFHQGQPSHGGDHKTSRTNVFFFANRKFTTVTRTSDVFCQNKSSQKTFGTLNLNITRIFLKWAQTETSLEIEDLRYIYPIQPLVYFH
jgi:hypothetical protein